MRNPAYNPETKVEPRVSPALDFHDRTPEPQPQETPKANLVSATEGVKFDQGKPQMSLIDSRYLLGTARVLTFGASKYAPHNWRKGMSVSRLYDALQRHLVALNGGEDLDPESGLPHVYHASCCLMFIANMLETRPDLDDRFKPEVV